MNGKEQKDGTAADAQKEIVLIKNSLRKDEAMQGI